MASNRAEKGLKERALDLAPPAMIAVVLLFWAYGPAALTGHPAALAITSPLIVIAILLLEFVHERHAGWRLNAREFFTDLFYNILFATAIAWMAVTLAEEPLLAFKEWAGVSTAWMAAVPWLGQVVMVIVILEFGQYWMHRLMHNSAPFWAVHAPHHHLTQLNAGKGAVGNPIELFLISLSLLALFDFEATALFAGLNVLNVITVFAHANVRSDPPIWYSFFFTTIRHHSLHHSTDFDSTRSNYGNALILLDRVFGTYREGEGVIVGQDDRKRLSIWEQTVFPFRPLIDRMKARRANDTPGGASTT